MRATKHQSPSRGRRSGYSLEKRECELRVDGKPIRRGTYQALYYHLQRKPELNTANWVIAPLGLGVDIENITIHFFAGKGEAQINNNNGHFTDDEVELFMNKYGEYINHHKDSKDYHKGTIYVENGVAIVKYR